MLVVAKAFVQVGLVGLLALSASACGGGSSPVYDAKATYACLRHRPGFRTQSRIKPPPKPTVFTLYGPGRFNQYLPLYDVNGVSGWEIAVRWYTASGFLGGTFFSSQLVVLDTVREERTMYRRLLNSSFLKEDLRNTTIHRNVFISWGLAPVPEARRSIILGCVRTGS